MDGRNVGDGRGQMEGSSRMGIGVGMGKEGEKRETSFTYLKVKAG